MSGEPKPIRRHAGRWVACLLLAAAALAGCSSLSSSSSSEGAASGSPSTVPAKGRVQSSTGGAVTIDVEWKEGGNGVLEFGVEMNTHSVDLDRYDLGELASLRDDTGGDYRPTAWRAAPGGHHRSGTLTFPVPESVSQGKAKRLQLVIRDVAGIAERVLTWELG